MMTPRPAGVIDTRLSWVAKFIVFLWVLLGIRLFLVSVVEHERFARAATQQQIANKEILAERGEIITQDEERLATNVTTYAVLVVPKNISRKEDFARAVGFELSMDASELLSLINNNKPYIPPVARNLTLEKAKILAKLNLTGLLIVPESVRFYPEGFLAAHLLGFVNAEGKGQYGLEGFYDDVLQGFKGVESFQRNPSGKAIGLVDPVAPARDGISLTITLDRTLQFIVEESLQKAIEKFNADSGSIVVLNAQNGEVLAMASRPTFDPNAYQEAGRSQSLFLNQATQATWEPGSVLKPIVMAAAINENELSPDTTETFSSSVNVDGWTINTAQNKAFGRQTMTQVLENSDNVAMVWVANKLGSERLRRYLVDFGFDEKTGIDLQGEAHSQILVLKEWRSINRATISFGQGIALTPLQLTAAYAALGNGGKLYWPHLVRFFVTADGERRNVEPREVRQVISFETSQKISAMLVSVVERGHGKRARVPGYKIAGKTGTAQVPSPQGGYEEKMHVGSFCGYAPAGEPLFAMCVKLDTPKNVDWAEASAAPVFGEIAGWILANYNVTPTE